MSTSDRTPETGEYDTSHSIAVRRFHHTHGMLPPAVETQDVQMQRCFQQLSQREKSMDKYIYLSGLRNTNVHLFYRLVTKHITDIAPLIYTPTVGDACLQWSHNYVQPEGLYLSYSDKGHIASILNNWPQHVEITVVTDGSRILGLGDLGINGMGIPVGKLALYVGCAGIRPEATLPLMLDLGTGNKELRDDPLYMGSRREKVSAQEEQEFMDEVMIALNEKWPGIVVQFEDFKNPFPALERYQQKYTCFNDDIQGTGAVVLAGIINAVKKSGVPVKGQRAVFMGAGSAGVGVAKQIVEFFMQEGLTEREARECFWLVDTKGLVTNDRGDKLAEHKVYFSRNDNAGKQYKNLAEVVDYVKPTILMGLSTIGGAFTAEMLTKMREWNRRPIIFPLSNPSANSECTFQDAIKYTNGTALFASGSPFPPVEHDGKSLQPGQGNNMYVFPGIGLGTILSKATVVTQSMIYASANALSTALSPSEIEQDWLYPDIARIRDVSVIVAMGVIRAAQEAGVDREMRIKDMKDEELEKWVRSKMYDPHGETQRVEQEVQSFIEDLGGKGGLRGSNLKAKTLTEMPVSARRRPGNARGGANHRSRSPANRRGGKMWNRILGKSTERDKKPSTSESQRKSEGQRSTPRRSDSQKSTTSSRKTTRNEEHDRGFNPASTSYSSTTQNRYPGTASASVASSYATAFNDPTDEAYLPPGLVRNASLADKLSKPLSNDGQRAVGLDSGSKSEKDKDDSATMEERPRRKERRGTGQKDEGKRESKSHRDKKRRNSGKGSERAMSTDVVAYSTSQRGDGLPIASSGVSGSSFVGQHDPRLEYTDDRPRAQSSHIQDQFPGQFPLQSTTPYRPPLAASEYADVRPHAQSSHVQDQFPGQFPAQSATPYRPPLATSEGGPGLAAEYYGDAGQSVIDQPGVRTHSPSLIVGAEPHLQAASVVAAPPQEPSASGGIGAAASFFDGTFSAGSDMEGHPIQKPATTNVSYSSAAPSTSTYTTSGARPSTQQSTSAPTIPTIGSAAAGAVAGYYVGNHSSKPAQPDQAIPSTTNYGKTSGSASHHQPSGAHSSYTSYPSSNPPTTKPGAAGVAAAAYHHNHPGSTHYASSHHGSSHHGSAHHASNGQYYAGNSMVQQHQHRHQGPFSKLVDFFKDPDGVAQFEEYTEYIGVCRHCFDPRSSPRDAPRKHHYRRRRSDERFGLNLRVDKDHRYSSSESESRRRKKNSSWLGAGIAGYGLGKMGENLFLHDNDSHEYHRAPHGKVSKSRRRRSSLSSERKSRTSYGVVNRLSDTLSRRGRSKDRVETGITADGKLYRKDSHGNIDTLKVKTDASHRRSRSRSRDRRSNASNIALGAALGASVVATHARQRSKSPKKAFVRPKHGHKESSAELASILKLNESDPRDSRHASRHSPESQHRKGHRKEKKSRGFFSFSNSSSSSSTSSDQVFGMGHDQKKPGRTAKPKRKGKESRDAEAALLGLGAAALAFNQSQRPKRKSELVTEKESKGKQKAGKHGHKGKGSSSSSEEDPWESASEGEYSSADSELAYGASLHRRSQESLSSESSGLDKWGWRWGSKRQTKKTLKDRRQSPTFDKTGSVAANTAMMTGASHSPPALQNQDSRMTSSSSIPLQYVYPMPTSDPTQFDVARHDPGGPSYQPYMSARPDPVPIQHPQPVAPVSPAVYTSQAPYTHSNSAPVGLSSTSQYARSSSSAPNYSTNFTDTRNDLPGAFPTASEGFGSFMQDPKTDPKPRRRDSSPVIDTSEYIPSSAGPRRRKSLKDDASSVRFELTKEQEDKDRRDERRRRKEEEKRRERLERRESEERKDSDRDMRAKPDFDRTQSAVLPSRGSEDGIRREPWAAPAAAGVIAAAIGVTVAAGTSGNVKFDEKRHSGHEERDVEVIVRERPASNQEKRSSEGRGCTSQKTGMSVWQAAAKVKRTPNHTGYAAYFTPTELLSKEPRVKETVGANADNDITVYQGPNMITIQPSEPSGHSLSRAYSFPITAEDVEHSVKPLPWAVPQLNLVEATPPASTTGSVVGDRSPRIRSPLYQEIHDIPLEPLESVSTPNLPDLSSDQPAHVEYTVIEPKGQSTTGLADSPVSDRDILESVPGISSLKKKQRRRRESPPGSEDDEYRRLPFTKVTEITPEPLTPRSPPHGVVEEMVEPHMPGSFGEDEEQTSQSRHEKEVIKSTSDFQERSRSSQELTGPSDNASRNPNVYSTEEDAFKPEDITNAAFDPVGNRPYGHREEVKRGAAAQDATEPSDNAGMKPKVYSAEIDVFEPQSITNVAIDPVGDRPHKRREQFKQDTATEDATEPSDNAGVKPYVYTAEPEPFEPEDIQKVAVDPASGDNQSGTSPDEISRSSPRDKADTNDNADYLSENTPSVAASTPLPSSRRKDSKPNKKSKRRSVGFDDNTSVISSPATYGGKQDSTSPSKTGRKGGIFGLFSKSTENLPESKGIQQTPVEASLEDFEEPRERKKKSKSRRSDRGDEDIPPVSTESVVTSQPEAQDDWDTPKKSKR
ncbi:MAG: hypothetical protein Q9226_006551, partial [Calogaya cf. arnoldii]